jgi:hypothetical protein
MLDINYQSPKGSTSKKRLAALLIVSALIVAAAVPATFFIRDQVALYRRNHGPVPVNFSTEDQILADAYERERKATPWTLPDPKTPEEHERYNAYVDDLTQRAKNAAKEVMAKRGPSPNTGPSLPR